MLTASAIVAVGVVVDIPSLLRQLEFANFAERELVAQAAAHELTEEQVALMSLHLAHESERVRLGVIELLWRAGHRKSMGRLVKHAHERRGDDRVFAVRALGQLATVEDTSLTAHVRVWLASDDPFVQAQAKSLAKNLDLHATLHSSGNRADHATEPWLVAELLAAKSDVERIALMAKLEAAGGSTLADVAVRLLSEGNADVVALLCRALTRSHQAPALLPILESARERLGKSPLAVAAIDDAILQLQGMDVTARVLVRLAASDPARFRRLIQELRERPVDARARQIPVLVEVLQTVPALWPQMGELVESIAAHVHGRSRTLLLQLCDSVLDAVRDGQTQPTGTLLSVSRILAETAVPGSPLCAQLRAALLADEAPASHIALCALCQRLATEEAAGALVQLLGDPSQDVVERARHALESFASPWVGIELHGADGSPSIEPRYESALGQPLVRVQAHLRHEGTGEVYALDTEGRPTAIARSEWGACACCSPPRLLTRRRGLRCPATWESYLLVEGAAKRESLVPFGRCHACDSVQPLSRKNGQIVCVECGAHEPIDARVPPSAHLAPMHGGQPDVDVRELPAPPTLDELNLIAPHIRNAMASNVFIEAAHGGVEWCGSGVIVARDGPHVAILTNRHVVEDEATAAVASIRALTVGGETVAVRTLWRADRGVDLALVEATLRCPDAIAVAELDSGRGLVGTSVFVVGNPLGLGWSYTAGSLSAVRHWTTSSGHAERILQTAARIGPGSSGGGLFHADGKLLGIVSFSHVGETRGSAHFALSLDVVREALAREQVLWRGRNVLEETSE